MTPGALATRERVRPPSMTRVIASLCELGFVARDAHPADGRQVLVSVSRVRHRPDRGRAPRQPGMAQATPGPTRARSAQDALGGRRSDVGHRRRKRVSGVRRARAKRAGIGSSNRRRRSCRPEARRLSRSQQRGPQARSAQRQGSGDRRGGAGGAAHAGLPVPPKGNAGHRPAARRTRRRPGRRRCAVLPGRTPT